MLRYLLEKEFKQFGRNPFLPRLVAFMPVLALLILPWAADLTIKNIRLAVVDRDRTPFSARLVEKAAASDYFVLWDASGSYDGAMESIKRGDADIILEIPPHFERDLVRHGVGEVLISANAVNGAKAALGSSYLTQIITGFAAELTAERGSAAMIHTPGVEVVPDIRYNPSMNYQRYMVPAFLMVLLTMLCGFLPALNIVMEKEFGTIEQINVTPIPRITFIVAKLIPYWTIGVLVMTLGLIIAWLVYGIVPAGSLWAVYAGFVIYVIALSGIGIVVSNYSATMQQAMFVMFFFLIIFILMSGLFTPIGSMPPWARKITAVNPLRYAIEIMRSIFFKGSGIRDLWFDFAALTVFAVGSNAWAVISYRKSS